MPRRAAATVGATCVLLAGCATGAPADERPVVRIAEAAQPSPVQALGRFLPSVEELAAALGTGPSGFMGRLVEGGKDMLLRSVGVAEAVPADCVGTAYRLEEAVYGGSPVQSVASTSWAGGGFDGPPVSGFFGVVQMSSAEAAAAFFAATTEQWRRCNGQTVALHQPDRGADDLTRISDVAFGQQVVSASVLRASSAPGSPPSLRALGRSGDCIVEVELTDPRGGTGVAPAVAITELVLDKISTLR
ncbi:sensor domain-containing protein [Mycolicibacterium sp.]|uniref:sensor domain-containing protein n=1 Tax=Mycolicibacterium sp. TaxID=2320850 RepID=UPI003D0FE063